MNSAIQRLNEEITSEYIIEASCDLSHILDTYDEGEEAEVNYVSDFYKSSRESTVENIGYNLKEIVTYILKTYTQFSSFEEYYQNNFNYSDSEFIVYRHVNRDHNEPTKAEIELWKSGELDLYAQYTRINIRVNSTLLDVDLIKELIKMESK